MSKLRSNCETPGCCPGVLFFSGLRVFYNLTTEPVAPGGVRQWAPVDLLTSLLVAESDGADPSFAYVSLHALTCVRENDGSVVGSAITIPNNLATPGLEPPGVTSRTVAPVLPLPCSPLTVGRGSASPQYRVEFRDGTTDGQVVWVDGSSTLVLPATHVKIQLVTPSNGFQNLTLAKNAGALDGSIKVPGEGLFVESQASASVSWSSRTSGNGAPGGLNTWTQTQRVTFDGAVPPVPNPMIFERPPFARRVSVIVGSGMVGGAAVLAAAQFLVGATFPFGFIPMGLIVASQHGGVPMIDIPNAATHIEVQPLVSDAGVGQPVSVVWEIGVS